MSRRLRPFPRPDSFADYTYTGLRVAQASPVAVTLVGSALDQKDLAVQPRRWVVERTFTQFG